MKCLLETKDLQNACLAIFSGIGHFSKINKSILPTKIDCSPGSISISQIHDDHFIKITVDAFEVDKPGFAFVNFLNLKSISQVLETNLVRIKRKNDSLFFETESGKIMAPIEKDNNWNEPEIPQNMPYRVSTNKINKASRQILAAAGPIESVQNLSMKFVSSTKSLWFETESEFGSCLSKMYSNGDKDLCYSVNAAKFCYLMKAITSWHTADTYFHHSGNFFWFTNNKGTFRIPSTTSEKDFGKTQKYYELVKNELVKIQVLRESFLKSLESCDASDPSDNCVTMAWGEANGQSLLRISSKGKKYDVMKYIQSKGRLDRQIRFECKSVIKFLRTYTDPICEIEIGKYDLFIKIPGQTRFKVCLKQN